MSGYELDDDDKHELIMYVGSLPDHRQNAIKNMIERIGGIINESRDGNVALSLLAAEITGLTVIRVIKQDEGVFQ